MSNRQTTVRDRAGVEPAPGATVPSGTWRSLLVTFGPSVALDLLLSACVVATALDTLPDTSSGRTARLLRLAASAGALLPWAYVLIGRPWHLRWGTIGEEGRKRLPGDELVPRPVAEMTRAITINAPTKEIWPWMVQMGAGRGGLYSYDWLENLAGLGIHSVDRIVPELQDLKEGDVLPLDAHSGTGPTVAELTPERAIVLHFADRRAERSILSWAYVLNPIEEGATRLIFRFKLDVDPRWLWGPGYALLVEIPHFVMERRMMLGIKERAERAQMSS
jgi:hypothetical protein